MRNFQTVNPKKIFYSSKKGLINIKDKKFDSKVLKIIKTEIKINNKALKPPLFKKYEDKYIVLDGKIRCKALYELKKKIEAIIL